MNDSPTFARCLTYLESQLGPNQTSRAVVRPPTITLSRMTGSGGLPIAGLLAELLQKRRPAEPAPWTVFDRSLIEKVLAEHHLPKGFSRFIPENRVSYIQDTVEELFGLHPSASAMVTQIAETILGLAEIGNCIVVGRGAHIVLAKCETAFHVRLVGTVEKRIERIVAGRQIDAAAAREAIETEDAGRRRYLKTYFDTDVDDALRYSLIINTDSFTPEMVAELIADAVLRRFPRLS